MVLTEPPRSARRGGLHGAALLRAAALVAVVIGLDQLTKHTIAQSSAALQGRSVFLGIHLVHIHNRGVAFGFLSGGGWAVPVFTLAALSGLLVFFTLRGGRRGLWIPTGLLIGGAVGNIIDRLANGSVTDFIKLPLWPAFNVADMAITFGVLALLWVLEGGRER